MKQWWVCVCRCHQGWSRCRHGGRRMPEPAAPRAARSLPWLVTTEAGVTHGVGRTTGCVRSHLGCSSDHTWQGPQNCIKPMICTPYFPFLLLNSPSHCSCISFLPSQFPSIYPQIIFCHLSLSCYIRTQIRCFQHCPLGNLSLM